MGIPTEFENCLKRNCDWIVPVSSLISMSPICMCSDVCPVAVLAQSPCRAGIRPPGKPRISLAFTQSDGLLGRSEGSVGASRGGGARKAVVLFLGYISRKAMADQRRLGVHFQEALSRRAYCLLCHASGN